jgi:hypothetical protein
VVYSLFTSHVDIAFHTTVRGASERVTTLFCPALLCLCVLNLVLHWNPISIALREQPRVLRCVFAVRRMLWCRERTDGNVVTDCARTSC